MNRGHIYLKSVDGDWYRQRLSGALIFALAVFSVLVARLYYLQVVKGAEFRRLSENNCVRLQGIPPARGLVFDRNGVLLVDNRPSFIASIVLDHAKQPEEVVRRVAEILEVESEILLSKLEKAKDNPSFKPIVLKRDLSRDAVAVIEAHKLDLPGVVISVEPLRHYIGGETACHLIGYMSEISDDELRSGRYADNRPGDFIGKFGIERACESDLHGRRGTRQVQVNALGQVSRVLKTMDAVPGKNVYLTLDVRVQQKAEELLKDKVGAVVAMDPSTGHVLAMASSPAFDPNAFAEGMSHETWESLVSGDFHPMENKAVQGQYPPGSTYKVVTALAGLEEGIIAENTTTYCPGFYRYGNRTYRCWKRGGHGTMAIVDAITQSCDVFFFRVGEKLGVDILANYAKASGLGSSTGIQLDREACGLVPTSRWKLKRTGVPWQGGETISMAIGQGFNLVTPLQMVTLFAAIANGGTLYRPTVVNRIEGQDGTIVKLGAPDPLGALPVTEKNLALVRAGLVNVVNQRRGTAWGARLPGMEMAGKTGTAQVVGMRQRPNEEEAEEIPFEFRDHAWFVAFAPAEHAKIAAAVLVEHGGHGSSEAAPIASEIVKTYLGVGDDTR